MQLRDNRTRIKRAERLRNDLSEIAAGAINSSWHCLNGRATADDNYSPVN